MGFAATIYRNGHSVRMKSAILILEDDPFIAEDMAWGLERKLGIAPVIAASNRDALKRIAKGVDFAFLDVMVLDGQSIPVADALKSLNLPFAFVTAGERSALPDHLKHEILIRKPASTETLVAAIEAAQTGAADTKQQN